MEEAVLCWRRAGCREIDRRAAWIAAGERLLDGDDPAGAVTCFRRALLDGEDAATWSRLAYAHQLEGEGRAAVRAYGRAVALEPNRPGLRYNLGCVLLACGRPREAMSHLEAAVKQEPLDAAAWNNLGYACRELGEGDRAQSCFDRALQLDPECHAAWNNLAGWHEEQGDGGAAVAAYSRALELNPGNSSYLLNRAIVLAGLDRRDEALDDLNRLCRAEPEMRDLLAELPPFAELRGDPRFPAGPEH
jgi:Flp pilus assembly protein TadD